MNKKTLRIAGWALGLSMAVAGIGVAVGASQKAPIETKAEIQNYSKKFAYSPGVGELQLPEPTNCADADSYWRLNKSATSSVELLFGDTYTPTTNITLTFDIACYGNGTNPSDSNLTFAASGKENNSNWTFGPAAKSGGTLPSSSSYTSPYITITKDETPDSISGLNLSILSGNIKQIRFRSVTVSFSYEVASRVLENITISTPPTKTAYLAGDSFDKAGMVVTANYDDASSRNVTNTCTFTPSIIAANTEYITVSYTENNVTKTAIQNISVITVSSVVLEGEMADKTYTLGDDWDVTGLYLTVTYSNSTTDTVDLEDVTFSASPAKANSLSVKSATFSGTYLGHDFSKTVSGISVSAEPVEINIVAAAASGKWNPTASGSTFTDSAGNTATLTTDAGWIGSNNPLQFGKNNSGNTINAASYVEIVIPFSEKVGIDAVSASFRSNGAASTVTLYVYGDTDNDLILTASVTGNNNSGATIKKSTDESYEKINASRLKYRFAIGGTGVNIDQISYQVGETVAEFGTMVDLAIQNSTSDTQFKVGDTFSASGLVLRATDNSVPAITKDLTTGFKFGTAKNDDSFSGHVFTASDAETGSFTVHVTATVGAVTMDVTYDITVTDVPQYSVVSDYSTLYEGEKVIIVAGEYAFGAFNVGSYGEPVSPVFDEGVVTDANGATEFTVRIYGDKFALQFGEYYLALNGDNNQIHRNGSLTNSTAWSHDATGILSPIAGRYIRYENSKFTCNTTGAESALYVSDKSIKSDAIAAQTFTYRYLHVRDYTSSSNYCLSTSSGGLGYFDTAATAYASLTSEVKTEFKKDEVAVARFNAWATANNKVIDLDTGLVSPVNGAFYVGQPTAEQSNYALVAIVAGIGVVSAAGGIFLISRRRREE